MTPLEMQAAEDMGRYRETWGHTNTAYTARKRPPGETAAIVRKMWIEGYKIREISKAAGISKTQVMVHRRRMGLEPRRGPEAVLKYSRHEADVWRFRLDGLSNPEIARRLGLELHSVQYIVSRLDVPSRGQGGHNRKASK